MKSKLVLTTLLIGGLLAGCSSGNSRNDSSSSSATTATSQSQSSHKTAKTVNILDAKVSLDSAISKFHKAFPDTKITEISLKRENNHYQYEINGKDASKTYELHLNADTGAQISKHTEGLDDDDNDEAILTLPPRVSLKRAVKAAQKSTSGQTATEASLENKNGTTYWDIQFGSDRDDDNDNNETEVKIDAQSGKLISAHTDD